MWEPEIVLAAGPLVLSFAVIYSVSAAAGVLWRNAIVCVMLAGTLWGVSFLYQWGYETLADARRAAHPSGAAAVNGELFAASRSAAVSRWIPDGGVDGRGGWAPALYSPPRSALPFAAAPDVYRLDGPHADRGERAAGGVRAVRGHAQRHPDLRRSTRPGRLPPTRTGPARPPGRFPSARSTCSRRRTGRSAPPVAAAPSARPRRRRNGRNRPPAGDCWGS